MKLPLSWLNEFIETGLSPEQISQKLTSAGLEVDSMESTTPAFSGVVIGLITHTELHPQADRLRVATVSDGRESFQVVCGAANCRTGIKVAFAKVGAILPDGQGKTFVIKKAKLRNVDSYGMLCAADELNLPGDSEGIIEYEGALPVGSDLASLYKETLYEIGLTPNLGHCANMIGIARELSATTRRPVQLPKIAFKEVHSFSTHVHVSVQDKMRCPRFACRLVKNVKIAASPEWMQNRLIACGIRPINNIVDVTNYVLLERGHPLHAYDYDLLKGGQLHIRGAQDKEIVITLDGKERQLAIDDILVCDGEKPVAIAGVMGCANTEVTELTTNILLEAAYFLPSAIRKTSKRLGLQTEASKRFERGTDPNSVLNALERAAMLIEQLAGGSVAKDVTDIKESEFPRKTIHCRLQRANALLGTNLSVSEVEDIFQRLEMVTQWNGVDAFIVKVPTYRCDISAEIDLVEEIARIYGYDHISKKPTKYSFSTIPHAPTFLFEREVRARLISEGLQEFLTCDLIGPSILEVIKEPLMPIENTVMIKNPTSVEQSILRTSLLPGLLQVVKHNIAHQIRDISGFEVGRIHFKEGEKFIEQTVAAVLFTGKEHPYHWNDKPVDVDFFTLKGILENFLEDIGIVNPLFKESDLKIFHTGRQASIYVGALEVGSMGEIHPAILRRLDVSQRILFAELNLQDLMQTRTPLVKVQPVAIYPSSERDWTITLPDIVAVQTVLDAIYAKAQPLLESVSLIDIYQSEKLGKGVRNLTLRLIYRDTNKTIAQESVETEHWRLIKEVEELLKN